MTMPNPSVTVAHELVTHDVSRAGAAYDRPAPADLTEPSQAPSWPAAWGWPSLDRTIRGVARLSDRQLALLLSCVLLCAGAWPLTLVEVPPYQDLPNHFATLTVMTHPEKYPEFVFNGFFKTNAALFAWLYVSSKVMSVAMAARVFALLTLAANALVLPRFVLTFTRSRRRMVVGSLFVLPMVHNWFVSMGMLDFALGVPLSLGLLMALDWHARVLAERASPIRSGALIVALGLLTWYAHVFPLLVVHLLVGLEIVGRASWRDRLSAAREMLVPLSPVTLLVVVSLVRHLSDAVGPTTAFVDYRTVLPVWELGYNLWSEWFWGFSKLTLSTLLPCLVLAFYGVRGRRESPRFFSPLALIVLGSMYCLFPYIVTNWFHVNSRLIPFIWMAFLLRVPTAVPKKLAAALVLASGAYSVGMGVDFVRLDQERREFVAGIESVPEGARLLPLLFRSKSVSDNTRNQLHLWGYYVTERRTTAPLLFAHSSSFPVTYSEPPPMRFNHLILEAFAPNLATSGKFCSNLVAMSVVVDDCGALYRQVWAEFYADALSKYDHLLVWDVTPEARAQIPGAYQVIYEQGRLAIFARQPDASAMRTIELQ